jgi:hypothetical protein
MAMSTRITLLMPAVIASLVIMVATLVIPAAQAQNENMTMEESTNASIAEYPDTLENGTTMEEETYALVGNVTGNMTSQNMTSGNMTS